MEPALRQCCFHLRQIVSTANALPLLQLQFDNHTTAHWHNALTAELTFRSTKHRIEMTS